MNKNSFLCFLEYKGASERTNIGAHYWPALWSECVTNVKVTFCGGAKKYHGKNINSSNIKNMLKDIQK